jgi:ATP-dependent exoDNAse (exonuclease V) beta subunit
VGSYVDFLLTQSGWTVTDPDSGELVPIRARHICLLFRSLRGFREAKTTKFVRELEVRDIPHVLVGGSSFHDREEVLSMRTALAAVERPADELNVFATLRGPLFALGDDALLAWREEVGGLHPLRPLEGVETPGILAEVREALEILGELHRRRNKRRFSQTVGDLLDRTRAHAGFAIWNASEQVLANVLRFSQLAREAEDAGVPSFRSFVEGLEGAALRGVDVQATFLEEGTEGVRMMTVHRSKGLEFPVVILCDPAQNKTFTRPSRWIDVTSECWYQPIAGCSPRALQEQAPNVLLREAEESDRVLYVATTRARDLLVIPALADEVLEGWTSPLKPAIYPYWGERLHSVPPPGCPKLGLDTVARRPVKAPDTDRGVRPGQHESQAGGEVVWWGLAGLPESKRKPHGLRHQQLLVDDKVAGLSARGIAAHEEWLAARRESARQGREGALQVHTATSLARQSETDELPSLPSLLKTEAAISPGRPGGIRFGSLVHGVLELIPFDLAVDPEPFVLQQARLLDATEEERAAALEAVRSALRHPLLVRAAASADCRREAPFAHSPSPGQFLEGTIDLVFSEERSGERRWVVVEFKTSAGDAETTRRYGLQLQTYIDAVATATGEEVEGTLLVV